MGRNEEKRSIIEVVKQFLIEDDCWSFEEKNQRFLFLNVGC